MQIINDVLVGIDDSDIVDGQLTIPEGVRVISAINSDFILDNHYKRENLKKLISPIL